MNYTVEYYHIRIKEDIESWEDTLLADYAHLLELLMEFGPQLRMPHSKSLGEGLFELRLRCKDGIGRVFYCFMTGKRIVILHSFIKKTQRTSLKELQVSRHRMKEVITWKN